MIRRVFADRPTFRALELQGGLNLVIADVTPNSEARDTRNGVGKTSLLEIIHYCLGGTLRKGDTLKEPALTDWTFSVELDLGPAVVTVSRRVGATSVTLDGGDGPRVIPVAEWIDRLGVELFDLPPREPGESAVPTFRSLVSYFARRGGYAYDHPFEHHPKTAAWDRQVNMGYLLGLGWRDATAFEMIRRRKKWLRDQKAAWSGGVLGEAAPRGRLEPQRVRLQQSVDELARQLESFQVHPEHARIQDEANSLTRQLHDLTNAQLADKQLLAYYGQAVHERAPDEAQILELFEAAMVELPGAVKRDIAELRVFHAEVVANRARFLEEEIRSLERVSSGRALATKRIIAERAQRLEILASHGALAEYAKLQSRLTELREQLSAVLRKLEQIDELETERMALKSASESAYERARQHHTERVTQREAAISLFNMYSEALYNEPGNLILDVRQTRDAPRIELGIEILRSKATGIERMKTFCLDLTIAALWASHPKRPGFLIHDSTLFEGVDERQRSLALALAARESARHGYQYILMLNSDELPTTLPAGFSVDEVCRLKLTDVPPSGSLFGVRF